MKIYSLLVIFALDFSLISAQTTNQISQFGITWTFDGQYQYGQYANGDYWVVGPVNIISISPASIIDNTGRTLNGSMINPSPTLGSIQGYDESMYATYGPYFDATLNVARPSGNDLNAANSLVVMSNSSLVSTISVDEADQRPQLQTAAVLTVVESSIGPGSFRPPYCGNNKASLFNISQLNYSLLAQIEPVDETPELSDVEAYFEKPWIDHVPNWNADYLHPVDNLPNYGREISTQVGIGALMLHLNFTNPEKETLLIRYVQTGIDLYGIVMDGGENNWPPNGGHESGRKWPILFAGLMLNNSDMINIGPGDGTGNVYFGEDGQTFYVTQADIDMVHEPDDRTPAREYLQEDIGLAEWGIVHATRPIVDNKHWEAAYRRCCTAYSWAGFVLAAHIMDVKDIWNHDALFDYQDRYMIITDDDGEYPGWRQTSNFVENMWDNYRADYGDVYDVPDTDFEELTHLRNFPNPFDINTTINYRIVEDANVKITLYDIVGRKVAVILNENQEATEYNVDFTAEDYNLKSGAYFYKIESGSYEQTNIMVFAK